MDEYIEREGLINNRPEGRNPKQFGKEEYNKGWNDCRSAFYALIDDMPAADVAQVRHGYWRAFTCPTYRGLNDYGDPIFKDGVVYYCSECGRKTVIKENYCPKCGAKMDLEV